MKHKIVNQNITKSLSKLKYKQKKTRNKQSMKNN